MNTSYTISPINPQCITMMVVKMTGGHFWNIHELRHRCNRLTDAAIWVYLLFFFCKEKNKYKSVIFFFSPIPGDPGHTSCTAGSYHESLEHARKSVHRWIESRRGARHCRLYNAKRKNTHDGKKQIAAARRRLLFIGTRENNIIHTITRIYYQGPVRLTCLPFLTYLYIITYYIR